MTFESTPLTADGLLGGDNSRKRLMAIAAISSIAGACIEFLSLFVLVIAILFFGNSHFGGFDQSVIVGAGYRFWEQQQPYRDFVMTVPVLFYFGAGMAFSAFGVSWLALTIATAAYAAATFATMVWGLNVLGVGRIWAVAIAFTAESLSMVLASYWWYNPITSITVCAYLILSLLVLRKPERRIAWAAWALMAALLSLSKPNSAGLVLVGSALGFALSPGARKPFLFFSGAAIAASLAILLVLRLHPQDVLTSYASAAGRGLPSWERFTQDQPPAMVALALLMITAVLVPWSSKAFDVFWTFANQLRSDVPASIGKRLETPEWIVLLSGATAAFLAFFTNGELKPVDLPMLLVPVAISRRLRPTTRTTRDTYLAALLIVLSLAGFTMGAARTRVYFIGPGAFYQQPSWGDFGQYSPFFQHLHEGYNLHAVMAATSELLDHSRKQLGRDPKAFFGPRMEFNYAAYRLPSPKGLPLFWHEGVGYPANMRSLIATAFQQGDFDLCIFFRGDFTYMPVEILSQLDSGYRRIDTHALTVFYRQAELIPTGFDSVLRPIPARLQNAFERGNGF